MLDTSVLSTLTLPDNNLEHFYKDFLAGRIVVISLVALGENLVAINKLPSNRQQQALEKLNRIPLLDFRQDVAEAWAQINHCCPGE